MSTFTLRFDPAEIPHWAARYRGTPEEARREQRIEREIAPRARSDGYYTKSDFLVLTRWKSPRAQPKCASNSAELIEEATATALGAQDERLRIGVLRLLDGVEWPTASVLLHFGLLDPYPILDFRPLWSFGLEKPPAYTFPFWWEYVQTCRRLAEESGVSMRDLDRALWQYSKEKQDGRAKVEGR